MAKKPKTPKVDPSRASRFVDTDLTFWKLTPAAEAEPEKPKKDESASSRIAGAASKVLGETGVGE